MGELGFESMHGFEFYGEAFARWLQEQNGGRPVRFERVEPGDERIIEDREQRDLDRLPSALEQKALEINEHEA